MSRISMTQRIATAAVMVLALVLIGCSVLSKTSPPSDDFAAATVVRVVDGDTIVVDLEGVDEKVRMVNVNAPESVSPDESKNTSDGAASSEFLKNLVSSGDSVWLQREVSDRDKYGRLLRHIWRAVPSDPNNASEVSEKMLDAIIVAKGYADVVDYPPDTHYSDMLRSLSSAAG